MKRNVRIAYISPDIDIFNNEGLSTHVYYSIRDFSSLSSLYVFSGKGLLDNKKTNITFRMPGFKITGFEMISRWLLNKLILEKKINQVNPSLIYERHHVIGMGVAISKKKKIPSVLELNDHALTLEENPFRKRIIFNFEKRAFNAADIILILTKKDKKYLQKFYHIPPEKIKFYRNGVDTEKFFPYNKDKMRDILNLPKDKFIFGFVGLFYPWQGVDLLIKSFANLVEKGRNDIFLLIVGGDGYGYSLRKKYLRLIRELNIEHFVKIIGPVIHSLVPKYISAMDIGIAPLTGKRILTGSHALKLMEYASCAKPYITTIAAKHVHDNLKGGIMISPNIDDLTDALNYALENEKQLKKWGELNRKTAIKKYDWKVIHKEIFENIIIPLLY